MEQKGGVVNIFKRIDILTSGQTISTIDEYPVLYSIFVDTDCSAEYSKNAGNVLMGTGDDIGIQISAAGEYTFCIPFVMNPLANANKYIPLFSRDNIRIKIVLNSSVAAFIAEDAGITDANVTVDSPELIYNVIELSQDAFEAVYHAVDGKFDLVTTDYRHTSANLTNAQNQSLVSNLGFAFSSLDRVIISHRESALVNAPLVRSIGNRAQRGLTEANLLLNGESIPSRTIKNVNLQCAEVMAELLIADRALTNFSHDSRLNKDAAVHPAAITGGFKAVAPTGATDNTGNFVVQIDTESMRSPDSDAIYSGVSTIGGVLQLQTKYEAAAGSGIACTLDVYGQFTSLLSLDMKGSQTWINSI